MIAALALVAALVLVPAAAAQTLTLDFSLADKVARR
jgi:hypothetical protein